LTRAVGTPEPLETPEIKLLEIKPGDRFLLASDGLHDMVAFADIKIILTRPGGPQTSAQDLLTAALKNGGKDNVTVIVVDI
jgi:protein phosphatase